MFAICAYIAKKFILKNPVSTHETLINRLYKLYMDFSDMYKTKEPLSENVTVIRVLEIITLIINISYQEVCVRESPCRSSQNFPK